MTTISNLNIVVQQGDLARDAQNIKNQALDTAQLAALERLEKENKLKNSVRETEEAEKVLLNNDLSDRKNKGSGQHQEKKKKRTDEETEKKSHDDTGRLLDTIV